MATITMKAISQQTGNSGHACTWDASGFARSQQRELFIDVGTPDFTLFNASSEWAAYKYGDGDRTQINNDDRTPLTAPASGESKVLELFSDVATDPIPFVTLKLTKKTGT